MGRPLVTSDQLTGIVIVVVIGVLGMAGVALVWWSNQPRSGPSRSERRSRADADRRIGRHDSWS